ncbi:1-aminocyclopropane-1-carboxylate synthase-like protein 1 isoform X1 [Patella vulgata]|uniref:1-aminocyclopropane-1-carboxylate synthase-like protein 1 isoform X1 n=1 Tax=Patella vulgata TaxID=6465 RepID=UPI0024A8FDB4|nr:1-aminocyclopropane-1-carboxylate synthase-like protein 1 isoform X1 [Patella vulgata]XP_055954330.1 1-aminocyclopropane-1-carboxylate synthase-like protein 1 isoform X1 [Patella vulgata]
MAANPSPATVTGVGHRLTRLNLACQPSSSDIKPTTMMTSTIDTASTTSTCSASVISIRANNIIAQTNPSVKYFRILDADPYDKQSNPNGIINLGTAENKLCADILSKKLAEFQHKPEEESLNYYPALKGASTFRSAVAKFVERHFKSNHRIDPENLVVLCGTTPVIETLSFAVAEHGDYFMIPTPYYHRIYNDINDRAGINSLDVPLYGMQGDIKKAYDLTVAAFETTYKDAVTKGLKVKGIILLSPHNPTGDIYTKNQLIDILNFANKYKLHVIMDEIYALSVFDTYKDKFTSVLQLDVPDPDRVHVIWGFSKDFGLSGYRVGCVYSRNQQVIKYFETVAIFSMPAAPILQRLEYLISDTDWIEKEYLPVYQRRLRESFDIVKQRLEKHGIRVYPSQASFFIWADVTKYLKERSYKAEEELLNRILQAKVYVMTGQHNFSCEPGWLRVIFSVNREQLNIGLDRIESVLISIEEEQAYKPKHISRL